MNSSEGIFRQRVGNLIEKEICEQFNLFYNRRQKSVGYYDAYKDNILYEIKASNINWNRIIISIKNHEKLLEHHGEYIFVSYSLKDKDKKLSVITDINIEKIYIISVKEVDKILKENGSTMRYVKNEKRKNKREMYRITLIHLLKAKDIKYDI